MAEAKYKFTNAEFRAFKRKAIYTAMFEDGVQIGTTFWLYITKRFVLQVRWGWYNEPQVTHFTLYKSKHRNHVSIHLPVHFMYGGEMYMLPRWKKPFFRKLGYNLGCRFYNAMNDRFVLYNLKQAKGNGIIKASATLS